MPSATSDATLEEVGVVVAGAIVLSEVDVGFDTTVVEYGGKVGVLCTKVGVLDSTAVVVTSVENHVGCDASDDWLGPGGAGEWGSPGAMDDG